MREGRGGGEDQYYNNGINPKIILRSFCNEFDGVVERDDAGGLIDGRVAFENVLLLDHVPLVRLGRIHHVDVLAPGDVDQLPEQLEHLATDFPHAFQRRSLLRVHRRAVASSTQHRIEQETSLIDQLHVLELKWIRLMSCAFIQYPRKVHEKIFTSYWNRVKNGKLKSVYLLNGWSYHFFVNG